MNRIISGTYKIFIAVFFMMLLYSVQMSGQGNNKSSLSVFLDMERGIDTDYIRQEITLVEYVRDREHADVHIILSSHPVGSTGSSYIISFIGYGDFNDKNFELRHWAPASNTSYETRKGYTAKIKMGLAPYMADSDISDMVSVEYKGQGPDTDDKKPGDMDSWKYWVFEVYAGLANLDLEETRNSLQFRYGFFADRITPKTKTRLRPYGNYYERNYKTEDSWVHTTRIRNGFDSYHIISLSGSEHWGAGVFGEILISTFDNMDFRAELSPAIEYSLFPYSEATRRSISFAWRFGAGYYNYIEETIFDKTEEVLYGQALIASANYRQPWGDIRGGITVFHHFHDLRSNRIDLSVNLNLRIVEGLSLSLRSSFDIINDQTAIPKADLSLEEILLEQRRRATSYRFSADVGLSYTFGSRISGVYNPRLDH